jgi:hypothetical protein
MITTAQSTPSMKLNHAFGGQTMMICSIHVDTPTTPPHPKDLFHNMLRTLGVNVLQNFTVRGKILCESCKNINKNGDHDTTCTVNMAQASNDALVSNQGYHISN